MKNRRLVPQTGIAGRGRRLFRIRPRNPLPAHRTGIARDPREVATAEPGGAAPDPAPRQRALAGAARRSTRGSARATRPACGVADSPDRQASSTPVVEAPLAGLAGTIAGRSRTAAFAETPSRRPSRPRPTPRPAPPPIKSAIPTKGGANARTIALALEPRPTLHLRHPHNKKPVGPRKPLSVTSSLAG
jgi:hypothetical protein